MAARTLRFGRIARVLLQQRLDTFIPHELLPLPARALLAPLAVLPAPRAPRGERLRLALEALGPVFVKFGQMLSTRRDLMPPDIAAELTKLQDQVPPFCGDEATRLVVEALGQPIEAVFAAFDSTPLASASVAQVHPAVLKDGRRVVVKVIRPGIERVIRQDIAVLKLLADALHRFVPDGRRLRPREVVEDYEHTVLDELDLQREAANAAQLRRNFIDTDLVYVPEVHWDYTRRNVMVVERIDGIPVTDLEALRAQGTDMKRLAERGVEIFFTQVFRDNFFHADMHPGNIFVARCSPQQPTYIAVDCAIIGSLSEQDQYYLARNLLSIFRGDYHEVAALHVECGWVPPETRVHEFEATLRTVCEPVFQKPLAEISFAQMLLKLFETARRFDMQVQPSLVLLQKTLFNIEGLGRQLYPELNLWETAQPYLENWVKERYSPSGMFQRVKRHVPPILEQLPTLPERLLAALDAAERLRQLELRQAGAQQQEHQARQGERRKRRLAGAAAILGAVLAAEGTLPAEWIPATLAVIGIWLWW